MFFFSYEPDREGMLEKSSVAQDFPIGKAVYSFLQESFSDGTAKDEHQMPMRVLTTTRPIPEQELNL